MTHDELIKILRGPKQDWADHGANPLKPFDKEIINRLERYHDALKTIAKWHGEFPETGLFWDEEKCDPMSYGSAYGSNGERNYMRQIAREALGE